MRYPRDLSGQNLTKSLTRLGYGVTRQTRSHLRLTTQRKGEHHLTIPWHGNCLFAKAPCFVRHTSVVKEGYYEHPYPLSQVVTRLSI